jgi:hypothetical protein
MQDLLLFSGDFFPQGFMEISLHGNHI